MTGEILIYAFFIFVILQRIRYAKKYYQSSQILCLPLRNCYKIPLTSKMKSTICNKFVALNHFSDRYVIFGWVMIRQEIDNPIKLFIKVCNTNIRSLQQN